MVFMITADRSMRCVGGFDRGESSILWCVPDLIADVLMVWYGMVWLLSLQLVFLNEGNPVFYGECSRLNC